MSAAGLTMPTHHQSSLCASPVLSGALNAGIS
eukprot:CAMPEP_0174741776 /NCGR_PEP_ID=MMETSP1094-20130205/77197_1 /TAXON_ID=156173 /ORGANISM="Chrysochromulina brevifilum, Strain UTEX LB 985" /LENGTH=31 /DNA_ID= /DNA_START= /DNA_END= /DNA_ORIENTATION=